KWGVLWLRWRDYGKFWAQVVRWTLRANARSDTTATVEQRDGQAQVTVEALDSKGEFINFLDTQLGVVNPDKRPTVMELDQVSRGGRGGGSGRRARGCTSGACRSAATSRWWAPKSWERLYPMRRSTGSWARTRPSCGRSAS